MVPGAIPTSTLAPALGATGGDVDSGPSLLMTVLGEFVLPYGGAAWTQTLVQLAQGLGVRDKAARQALSRLEARGFLSRERVGRRTRWHLTETSTDLLVAGAERIYSFGQPDRTWDGRWLVVLASVPEVDRADRYRMSVELSWAGFGSLGHGVWISPWVTSETTAAGVLQGLGVEATVFRAEIGALGSGTDVAARAWDLPELRARYRSFLDQTAAGPMANRHDAAIALTLLVHRWRRFPFVDPDLPVELLPAGWPGPEASARFVSRRAELLEPACEWWSQAEG